MRVLMISMSDVWSDARVVREATSLGAAGIEVVVIGRGRAGTLAHNVSVASVGADRGLAPVDATRWPDAIRRTGRWALLPDHRNRVEAAFRRDAAAVAAQHEFDVVHAHDFIALPLAIDLQRSRRVGMVYDAHECWTGRRLAGRPTPLADRRQRALERELGGRADAVITVSGGIAAWFSSTYGWDHVTVVRNTFPMGAAPSPGGSPGQVRGVVYAGRVGFRRDLETVAAAANLLEDLTVDIVGPVDEEFTRHFDTGRARLHPPVRIDDVDQWYRRAGLAAIPLADDCLNHRLALPNKVFQAVRAGVPVVAADLPELRGLVHSYDLGTVYRPGDPASFADAAQRAAAAAAHHRRQVVAARGELSWAVDSRALLAVYDRMPARR